MHTEMYRINETVNDIKQEVTPEFIRAFEAEYNSKSYSSKFNYGRSALEFILKKHGIAIQKNWQHDSIFHFAHWMKIDWKVINESTGNASITSKDSRGNTTRNRDCTHYGFIKMKGDPFKVGSILEFELIELVEKEYVWNNPIKSFDRYFLYRPNRKKSALKGFTFNEKNVIIDDKLIPVSMEDFM